MIKWLIEYYTHISSKLSSNKREYIEIILTYTLNTHYSIYCEYDKDHARAYKEIVDFDQYLLKVNKALYERINCMAYIRYNRKTKFKFVRLNGRKWNTAMKMARRLKGKLLMKKILVISWFYPPINSSEGLVTYKLLRNSKLQYDVCMQESNASWSYGNKEYLPECENVRKIPIQADTLEIWKNKTIEYFNAHKKEYDIIMTRSMPPESHEIGLKIKEIKPEIKWIASFGDPIANNPFVLKTIKKISPYSLQNRYIRPMGIREIISPKRMIKNEIWKKRMKKEQIPYKKEQELEDAIITKSDYIIMNNPYQKQYMTGKYSDAIKAKAIVLPHSFDYSLYDKEIDAENSGKIRMVYIGHLDDIRTPHLFLKAIASMKKDIRTWRRN